MVVARLDEADSQVICDIGVFIVGFEEAFEVLCGLIDEAELEQNDAVVEFAQVVLRLEFQASLEQLEGLGQLVPQALLRRLYEVVVCVLPYGLGCTAQGHQA